jgi:hypothetical protein
MCVGWGELAYNKIPVFFGVGVGVGVGVLVSTEQARAAVLSRRIQDAAGLNHGLPSILRFCCSVLSFSCVFCSKQVAYLRVFTAELVDVPKSGKQKTRKSACTGKSKVKVSKSL